MVYVGFFYAQRNFSKLMSRFESREKMKNSSSFPGNNKNTNDKSKNVKRNSSLSSSFSGSSFQALCETKEQPDEQKVEL